MMTMMRRLPQLLISLVFVLPSLACSAKDSGTPEPGAPEPAAKTEAAADPAPREQLPDGGELLAAHVAAAGGADKIATFETVHAVGTVSSPQQKLSGTMQLWWQKGDKFYLEQEIEGVGKSRVGYDGKIIWLDDPITGLRILEGEEAQSYIQSGMMFPGHQWREQFSAANTLGKHELDDGSEAWEVELVSANGPSLILGLDTETKLIRYTKTTQVTLMGELPIEAHAEDYRDVNGYKFAMRKHSSVKSLLELDEEITDIEVNVPVDPSMFTFPAKRELVPSDPAEQAPVQAPTPKPTPNPSQAG